ncbi:peptide chain release factor N(5)-glutamine methyltransferase [Lentibacillus cibarius]|uniref:Release factor glutamine methyltransferase n=1 Tax=Lentibacillus cibarius TaxID=2583219 RepID=A0A549YG17_9BACI|nr:peptide chain release factor N(5)-glutamine methyltransferase [Lentibacillus cibarius]TRM10787.1 peptide chain release factor N(5)-glutamine methyltransferase [Lentibacillus cibarius]
MEKDVQQYEVLRRASLFLEQNGREPKFAELLLMDCLQVTRTTFLTMMHDVVPEAVLERFWQGIQQHVETGIPLEHLTGMAPFYGRDFHVNEHTLIPRPETEELVEKVIHNASGKPLTIVDIGTGSGVIAITLALELPHATVYATDISPEALHVARENADKLGADVTFLHGDGLAPLINENIRPDILVSNPPYIAASEKDQLADTVKNFDPELALFAADDGLAAYKQIIADLTQVINRPGHVFLEIGHEQGTAVKDLLHQAIPESTITILPDINRKNRIVHACIPDQ